MKTFRMFNPCTEFISLFNCLFISVIAKISDYIVLTSNHEDFF
ncbi:hypothetical protein BACCOP_01175 [Phocaeicola coprocola DSM 17136]|uniref:Uncharacterized protein n=1 Tax=Phocaeicola coprocola DSM 17136 TaxID=470145 RepID=B3JH19_9BACT|nr:hypothetical protein BACCOP_01175 [Phocaeicola coprocola DSM 17136]